MPGIISREELLLSYGALRESIRKAEKLGDYEEMMREFFDRLKEICSPGVYEEIDRIIRMVYGQ